MNKQADTNDMGVVAQVVIWKDIPGFSKYQASNTGLIKHKRFDRLCNPYEVKSSVGTYLRASALSDDGKHRTKEIHYLVCLAFHGMYPSDGKKYDVNHKDGDKHNNVPDNLEWMTRSENLMHAYKSGLRSDNMPVIVHNVVSGEAIEYHSISEMGRAFNINKRQAAMLIRDYRDKPYLDRYTFEYDASKRKVKRHSFVKDIRAKDYVSGKTHITTDAFQMEQITGVTRATVLYHLRLNTKKLCNGYVFMYLDDKSEFPEYDNDAALDSRNKYLDRRNKH